MKTIKLVIASLCLIAVCSAYTIPDPEIQLLSTRGFRISIPDVTGIQFFTFNGHVNRNIRINESGSTSGEIFRATSGRWVFEDSRTTIQGRDVLHYWLHVQHNGTPYEKTGSWTIPPIVRPPGCIPSVTTTSKHSFICKDQLILEDNFEVLNSSIWSREILIPSQPHYEFCVYHNHPQSVEIRNGVLCMIPSLLEDSYGEGATGRGTMILAQCTSDVPFNCNRTAAAYNILPPVISARLTTANKFSFRYGRVEIRAKFPEGDWLYPELWLQPKNPGQNSGLGNARIRLGMARGNRVLTGNMKTYSGHLLEFGLRVGSAPNFQDREVQMLRTSQDTWTSGFHVYSTTWNADGFVFHVDGEVVGRLNPGANGWFGNTNSPSISGNVMAPFDGEFYITLGVGVGGVRDFPDNIRSGDGQGYDKPWKNVAAKAMLRFWQAKDKWLPSWRTNNNQNSQLQIDYVRVWAV